MSTLIPFHSDDFAIRAVQIDGEPWFVGKDVAVALGYVDTVNALKQHCKGVAKHHPIADGLGRAQETRVLAEADVLRLIVSSKLPAAEKFERWVFEEVLPSIRKTGSYSAKPSRPTTLSRNQVAAGILLLRSAAEDLKFAPSAVLGGYQRMEVQLGVTGLLPGYAVDSANSASGSSDETKAAGELLEQFGVGLSAIAFNRLLMQHGILKERERPSSKGGTKKFKVCVNLEYGKNLTSPNNPRETQPHWYVHKFQALLDMVLPAKPTVAA